jgi:two-component system, cell cycle response regulator
MCQVLLIDPDRKQATMLDGWLKKWDYKIQCVTNLASAAAALEGKDAAGIVIVNPGGLLKSCEEILAHLARVQAIRPIVVLAIMDEMSAGNGRLELPILGAALRPDEILVRPLEPRQTRIKMRSAEMLLNVQEQLAEAARAVQFLSSHDALTRLVQRQAAIAELKRETQRVLRTNAPMSIVLMDLDLFAQLNANAGHTAGDAVLREVGDRLRQTIRGYDAISRYGSDEFLILLPECKLEHAVGQAERIHSQVLGAPFTNNNADMRLSACFAITESYGRHPDWVLKELEETLQVAKNRGAGTIVCAAPLPGMIGMSEPRPNATVTRGMMLAAPSRRERVN